MPRSSPRLAAARCRSSAAPASSALRTQRRSAVTPPAPPQPHTRSSSALLLAAATDIRADDARRRRRARSAAAIGAAEEQADPRCAEREQRPVAQDQLLGHLAPAAQDEQRVTRQPRDERDDRELVPRAAPGPAERPQRIGEARGARRDEEQRAQRDRRVAA